MAKNKYLDMDILLKKLKKGGKLGFSISENSWKDTGSLEDGINYTRKHQHRAIKR